MFFVYEFIPIDGKFLTLTPSFDFNYCCERGAKAVPALLIQSLFWGENVPSIHPPNEINVTSLADAGVPFLKNGVYD
jgi:hypothetical protein